MTQDDSGSFSPQSAGTVAPSRMAVTAVWLALGLMAGAALAESVFGQPRGRLLGDLASIAILAVAAAALILAVARLRGGIRMADAFLPLVLLNPLFLSGRAGSGPGIDPIFLSTGILGLMTAAIVAMKRDNLLRYLAIGLCALALATLSKAFLMLLPALLLWFLYTGFLMARSPNPRERVRGFVVMALGEIYIIFFGLACILERPEPMPPQATVFSTIVSVADFPLIVLAIVMLALGWRKGPHSSATPPYFAGILALLVGLLTLLLNNFQSGTLPPPGADQTVVLLCLVYIVFALHGPRRLQWVVPPALLVAAVVYTVCPR